MARQAASDSDKKDGFSRREREIMDALYKLGKASAADIRAQISDPPSYTAIRTLLTILEKKGHVRHASDGKQPQTCHHDAGALHLHVEFCTHEKMTASV